jgi:tetratricopeptide (TPR) repeat protein
MAAISAGDCYTGSRPPATKAMNQELIHNLLSDLKNTDMTVRERACAQLWRIWFWQKGRSGLAQIETSEQMIATGNLAGAEVVLTSLVDDLPDFAEAWNRRAVLYYLKQEYCSAIADCQQVIEIVPWHFGAWHGLGLCQAALGNYSGAITAIRQALEIQPYSIENQRLLLECTAQL